MAIIIYIVQWWMDPGGCSKGMNPPLPFFFLTKSKNYKIYGKIIHKIDWTQILSHTHTKFPGETYDHHV
jgi:hypothetical protein